MAKPKIVEKRSDFSGGINVAASGDTLNDNELTVCVNARVETFGGIMRRPGSKKFTATALGNGLWITGIFQWTPSGGPAQLVVISADGNLYYSNAPYTSFTQIVPAQVLGGWADFQPFRDNSPGAPLVLFFATGSYGRVQVDRHGAHEDRRHQQCSRRTACSCLRQPAVLQRHSESQDSVLEQDRRWGRLSHRWGERRWDCSGRRTNR
jgi:hypothetical protein